MATCRGRVVALVLISLGLCACGGHDGEPDKVKAAVDSLNGAGVYEQPVFFKQLDSEHNDQQTVYLVPMKNDPKNFRIVDQQGVIYHDYQEFLLNNHLTP